MWLSKMLSKQNVQRLADEGVVTNSDKNGIEAASDENAREISTFSPYGYTSRIPNGEEIILVSSGRGNAALGVKSKSVPLDRGEVLLSSLGGASVRLKNDGSVIINEKLTIDREGRIHHDEQAD